MKHLIYTLALLLGSLGVQAQTAQPDLPAGALRYSQTLWIAPDSTLWTGKTGNYIRVADWHDVDSLFGLGYDKGQVDSAIAAQIGLISFPVTSVNGETGAIMLDANDIGLGNVDNTSDANKPISTATQDALDLKEDKTNKVTSLNTPNNTTYPTTQAVKSAIDAIEPPDVTGSDGIQVSNGEISPVFGTAAGTVAQGNDSRINNGQTAYGWGDYRQFGLGVKETNNSNWASLPFGNILQYLGSTFADAPTNGGLIKISSGGGGDVGILASYDGANLYFRGNPGTWSTVWHSGNFTPPVGFTRSVNGLVPAPGGSGTTRYLREDGSWVDPSTGGGGGTATDLSIQNRTSTTLQIGSSTGTNATVPVATTSLGGLMSASDKVKLNGLSAYTASTGLNLAGNAFSVIFGTAAGTVAQGNDSRINNGQTAYGWGDYREYGIGLQKSNAETNLFNYYTPGKWITPASGLTNRPGSDTRYVVDVSGGTAYSMRLANQVSSDRYWLNNSNGSSNSAWVEIWHSGNFAPSNYLTTANFTWPNLSGKPSTFPPSAHIHNASDIVAGQLSMALIPTGTTGSTVALGNHTHTFSAITSKPSTLSGYGITDAMPTSWTISAGSGLSGGGSGAANRTLAVDGTVLRTTGNQVKSGTLGVTNIQGSATSIIGGSASIPTDAQSLFTASVSTNTTYTLTNLSGSPRHIQVMVTNTSSSNVTISFNAALPVNQTNIVLANTTAIFTFLINNGTAYGTKTQY